MYPNVGVSAGKKTPWPASREEDRRHERGSLLIPAILWRRLVVDVAKGDGRGKTPDLSPSGFLKCRNFARKHLRRHGRKHVVPAADLRYFDASHFALGQNAEAIADAIIQTFAGDDGSPKRAAALKLIEVISPSEPLFSSSFGSQAEERMMTEVQKMRGEKIWPTPFTIPCTSRKRGRSREQSSA